MSAKSQHSEVDREGLTFSVGFFLQLAKSHSNPSTCFEARSGLINGLLPEAGSVMDQFPDCFMTKSE